MTTLVSVITMMLKKGVSLASTIQVGDLILKYRSKKLSKFYARTMRALAIPEGEYKPEQFISFLPSTEDLAGHIPLGVRVNLSDLILLYNHFNLVSHCFQFLKELTDAHSVPEVFEKEHRTVFVGLATRLTVMDKTIVRLCRVLLVEAKTKSKETIPSVDDSLSGYRI